MRSPRCQSAVWRILIISPLSHGGGEVVEVSSPLAGGLLEITAALFLSQPGDGRKQETLRDSTACRACASQRTRVNKLAVAQGDTTMRQFITSAVVMVALLTAVNSVEAKNHGRPVPQPKVVEVTKTKVSYPG